MRFGCAFKAADTLVVTNDMLFTHFDIHRASDIASVIHVAGCFIPADLENAEEIGNTQHGAVWAGVFTPRPLNEQRGDDDNT